VGLVTRSFSDYLQGLLGAEVFVKSDPKNGSFKHAAYTVGKLIRIHLTEDQITSLVIRNNGGDREIKMKTVHYIALNNPIAMSDLKKVQLEDLAREVENGQVTDEECAQRLKAIGATEDELMELL
jgi:hypothetical protein